MAFTDWLCESVRTVREDSGLVDPELADDQSTDADDEAVQQRLRELGYL